jgi:DNA-binding NtrC family response regulator
MSDVAVVHRSDLDPVIEVSVTFDPGSRNYREIKEQVVNSFERKLLELVLARHSGNLSAAARELKMDRKHLHDLALKHGFRKKPSSP